MREIKFRLWMPATKTTPAHMSSWEQMNKAMNLGYVLTTTGYWDKLMQYTGLVDLNGKEVYEGDILKITNPLTKGCVIKSVWWNGETVRFNGIPTSQTNVYEVIGNIYENPEMVKEAA